MLKQEEGTSSVALGRIVQEARRARALSVEQLAERADVSSGLISQLERGLANPSFRTLQKLAAALDLSLSTLFQAPDDLGERVSGAKPQLQTSHCGMVVRANERKKLVLPREGIAHELLTPDLNRQLEVIRSVLPLEYDNMHVPFVHEGEECVHLLNGSLEVHVGGEAFTLETGDSITYDPSQPHWWRNIGRVNAEIIAAVTPPSF
ncbi:MAG: helix-turn-helix domain-containing protein [bacterium]|nr:helix-turn-helix domain-containing protein [bacterium]